jgi:hypothetical protein
VAVFAAQLPQDFQGCKAWCARSASDDWTRSLAATAPLEWRLWSLRIVPWGQQVGPRRLGYTDDKGVIVTEVGQVVHQPEVVLLFECEIGGEYAFCA